MPNTKGYSAVEIKDYEFKIESSAAKADMNAAVKSVQEGHTIAKGEKLPHQEKAVADMKAKHGEKAGRVFDKLVQRANKKMLGEMAGKALKTTGKYLKVLPLANVVSQAYEYAEEKAARDKRNTY